MAYENISYSLSPADETAIKDAIKLIESKLPFLVTLSGKERQKTLKLGTGSLDFVMDSRQALEAFPNVVPASFNKLEYDKDTSLFRAMTEIKLSLDSLAEGVGNTHMAVGGEAMNASLELYAYIQTAAKRIPGLRSVADKLKERFKRQGKSKKPKKDSKDDKDSQHPSA